MNLKEEILRNADLLSEEMADEDKEKVRKAILTFTSMFPSSDGFSFEQVKAKIGGDFPSEDFQDVVADMILDGLLKGTPSSFFITDKGRSQVETKKTNKPKKKTARQVVNDMDMSLLMVLANAMEAEDWDDYDNPSDEDIKKFKDLAKQENFHKEYPEIKKFNDSGWRYFYEIAFSHL